MIANWDFVLLRHGEPDWSPVIERGAKGWGFDLAPLSSKGVAQVEALADAEPFGRPSLIITSSTVRTLQTAHILAARWQLPLEVAFGLHEWVPDLSLSWSSHDQVEKAEAEFNRMQGLWPPGENLGWETLPMLRARVDREIQSYSKHKGVLVVSHASVIRALSGRSLNYSEYTQYQLGA